jgi:tetratricopeptide (TPR) repeat protein
MPLEILISHAHTERALAEAWKRLLRATSAGTVLPWYSSDSQPEGGMMIGEEWREQLRERIAKCDYVIAVLSPQTRDRAWILWECGVANGTASGRDAQQRGVVIPVLHSMTPSELTNPLSSFQVYSADKRDHVLQICTRLAVRAGLPEPQPELWAPLIDQFMSAIAANRPRRARRPEEMAMWRGRIEQHIQSGRLSEVPQLRSAMYAGFGKPFEPQDAMLHDLLSRAMLDCRCYREANEEVDHALQLLDFDVHLLHRRALAAVSLHDLASALETVRRLTEMDASLATNPEIAGLEGRIYRERYEASKDAADLAAARVAYTRGMEANPSTHYCAVNAGSLALLAKDEPAAAHAFARALDAARADQAREPVSFWADFTVGECLLGQGDIEGGHAEYARGLQRRPPPSPLARESALKGALRMSELKGLGDDVQRRFRELLG